MVKLGVDQSVCVESASHKWDHDVSDSFHVLIRSEPIKRVLEML